MVTFIFDIVSLDCRPEVNGVANIVDTVHWSLVAVDGQYSVDAYGYEKLMVNENGDFTPYDNLSKDDVIEWVKIAIGSEVIEILENSLADQIETMKNPPVVKPPLPWGT
jgi:hypothetical protein